MVPHIGPHLKNYREKRWQVCLRVLHEQASIKTLPECLDCCLGVKQAQTMFVLLFLTTPAQNGILIQNKLFSPQSALQGKSEVIYLTAVFLALAAQNYNLKT